MTTYGPRLEINATSGEIVEIDVTNDWINSIKPLFAALSPAALTTAVNDAVSVTIQLRSAQQLDGSRAAVVDNGEVALAVALDGESPVESSIQLVNGGGLITVSSSVAGVITVRATALNGGAVQSDTVTIEVTQ